MGVPTSSPDLEDVVEIHPNSVFVTSEWDKRLDQFVDSWLSHTSFHPT